MNLDLLLKSLLALPRETEWVELKHNNDVPEEIGEYLSALANSAALHGREAGYIVWGIEDVTKRVMGTTVNPRRKKIGTRRWKTGWRTCCRRAWIFAFTSGSTRGSGWFCCKCVTDRRSRLTLSVEGLAGWLGETPIMATD